MFTNYGIVETPGAISQSTPTRGGSSKVPWSVCVWWKERSIWCSHGDISPGREIVRLIYWANQTLMLIVPPSFPSADFHMATQRLCVGTSEGAVIMYDLKTATRLYVLEGHKKQIDICSFSPDGRRLVSVSIEESVAKVWKVGSSFVSLFTPGVPPRQGHSGSDPYKLVPFNLGQGTDKSLYVNARWCYFVFS